MKKQFLQSRAAPRAATEGVALPDEDRRYGAQRQRGFGWLRFSPDIEREYRNRPPSSAARFRRVYALMLLGVSLLLAFAPTAGMERWLLAMTVTLGWAVLYLWARDSREHFLVQGELRLQAHADPLTGTMNRRAFREHLELVWRQAERENVMLGLAVLDLDHFKALNDSHGHAAGDLVLCTAAAILKSYALRPLDAVCRYGGDEFVVVWYDTQPAAFTALVQLLPAKLWMGLAGTRVREANMTVSGGAVLVHPGKGVSIDAAIRLADEQLYKIKHSCRGVIALSAAELKPAHSDLFEGARQTR